jgi:hypothetical protein
MYISFEKIVNRCRRNALIGQARPQMISERIGTDSFVLLVAPCSKLSVCLD